MNVGIMHAAAFELQHFLLAACMATLPASLALVLIAHAINNLSVSCLPPQVSSLTLSGLVLCLVHYVVLFFHFVPRIIYHPLYCT